MRSSPRALLSTAARTIRRSTVAVVLAGVLGAGSLLVACATEGAPPTPSDPVLAQGQGVYNQSCASCHGRGGGGGQGAKLAGVVAARYPNIADQEAVIANGRSSMPSFKGSLSAEEINAVARYEREVLGTK